jgi:diaminohydroxyphosphoribosylaminopyrimidine deaminase/5-amino-6-(5-phosphoribosylamino)uracil reductase
MEDFMELALKLAKKANPRPNPRVGAVVVKDGKVMGKGYHRKPGMPHAEIEAMDDANDTEGATLYVTMEPCSHTSKRTPPCTQAIVDRGIKRVVYAMNDPNPLVQGAETLRKAGIKVIGPTHEKKAKAINKEYISDIGMKPFVAIKMAMSADGKTATRTGDSKWISGEESREEVHRMRSAFDAVMVGGGTVKSDNPRLTSRIKGGRNPWRIIVDGDFCISADSKVLKHKDRKTIIATTERASKRKVDVVKRLAHIFVLGKKEVDMGKLMAALGAMGIRKLLIEGGSSMNASALEAGIVDRLYLFVAPKIIGGKEAKGVVGGRGIERVSQAKRLRHRRTRRFGEDLLLEYDVLKG